MVQLAKDSPDSFRVIGSMKGADTLMNQVLFLGTYPGLTTAMLDYEIDIIQLYEILLRKNYEKKINSFGNGQQSHGRYCSWSKFNS